MGLEENQKNVCELTLPHLSTFMLLLNNPKAAIHHPQLAEKSESLTSTLKAPPRLHYFSNMQYLAAYALCDVALQQQQQQQQQQSKDAVSATAGPTKEHIVSVLAAIGADNIDTAQIDKLIDAIAAGGGGSTIQELIAEGQARMSPPSWLPAQRQRQDDEIRRREALLQLLDDLTDETEMSMF